MGPAQFPSVLDRDSHVDTLSFKWTQRRARSVQLALIEDNSAAFG